MKRLFKITFTNEKHETVELFAENAMSSDILGFVEIDGLVFIDSSDIIISPERDRVKKMFSETVKLHLPISSIQRIEEVMLKKNTPVLQIYCDEKNT